MTVFRTGIPLRKGQVSTGGLNMQPIPLVTLSSQATTQQSGITPVIAAQSQNTEIIQNTTLRLPISASVVFLQAGQVQQTISNAVATVIPQTAINSRGQAIKSRGMQIIHPSQLIDPNMNRRDDILSLARVNVSSGQTQPRLSNGLSILRPEIISAFTFEPLFKENSLEFTPHGLMTEFQFQTRVMRKETLKNLVSSIKRTDQAGVIDNLSKTVSKTLNEINFVADFIQSTTNAINNLEEGFDVKSYPDIAWRPNTFKTLKDYYETTMQFSRNALNGFSNTKTLMQALFDLRVISENYSLGLLDVSDADRLAGGSAVESPVSIDKSYDPRAGFNLSFDSLKSFSIAINAAETNFFRQFNSDLPRTTEDRIKVLLVLLSKELRVSRGLGRAGMQRLLRDQFGATSTDGNPFDNALGTVGNNIFDPTLGINSLASTLTVEVDGIGSVLPFERKYIDVSSTSQKTYTPGSVFFTDTLLSLQNGTFNFQPLREYVQTFSNTVDDVTTLYANLFDFGSEPSDLSPVNLFKRLAAAFQRSLTLLTNQVDPSPAEASVSAIMKLATNDLALKGQLFQYLLLKTLYSQSQGSIFIENLVKDLRNDIRSLNYCQFDEQRDPDVDLTQPNQVKNYLDQLAQTIQNRIIFLIQRQRNFSEISTGFTPNIVTPASLPQGKTLVRFDTDTTFGITAALNQSKLISEFVSLLTDIEATLGNEVRNIFDSARRTRFNALSMSTIMLMLFEVYIGFVIKFFEADFVISSQPTFPNMVVDIDSNQKLSRSFGMLLLEPERSYELVEAPQNFTALTQDVLFDSSSRTTRPANESSRKTLVDQAAQAAFTGNSLSRGDVVSGILRNDAIIGGKFATAGTRATQAQDLIQEGVSQQSDSQNLLNRQAINQVLNSIFNKLIGEDLAIASGINLFISVKRRLRATLDLATAKFNNQTLQQVIDSRLSIEDLKKNLSPLQARLLVASKDKVVSSVDKSSGFTFISTAPDTISKKSALYSLANSSALKQNFGQVSRKKILSVGIPAGFSKTLVEHVNAGSVTKSQFITDKSNDVIMINVYKRSLEFPELIWKPQGFLFDLSLFVSNYDNLDIQPTDVFNELVQRLSLLDYEQFREPESVTLHSIQISDRYSFLNEQTRTNLIFNHVKSDLMQEYIRLLSAINLAETTFVDTESQTYKNLTAGTTTLIDPIFSEVVRQFLLNKRVQDIQKNSSLRPLPDLPIKDMIESPLVDEPTKDILKLVAYGNLGFKPDMLSAQLFSPKLFDRVFNLILDIDEFEIDYPNTTATESGKKFFEKNFIQRKLRTGLAAGIYKFQPGQLNDPVLDDFFVTIDLAVNR